MEGSPILCGPFDTSEHLFFPTVWREGKKLPALSSWESVKVFLGIGESTLDNQRKYS